jgi:hypothetical protein
MSNEIRLLSMAFKTDSYHNLALAKAAKDNHLYSREPMRAKVLVLIHMSIECALKCMISLERLGDDLGEIYQIIKKAGHDLSKLTAAVSSPALDVVLRSRLRSFNPLGVNLRYGFEVILLNADTLFSPGRSPEFEDAKLEEAFELADFVCELAIGLHKTTYPEHFVWKDGDNAQRVIQRIRRASSKPT